MKHQAGEKQVRVVRRHWNSRDYWLKTADNYIQTSWQPQATRRQWHPTPVLLPRKSHGWRSLVGCSPWGLYELDTMERFHFHFSLSCIGEGNGSPLQCSCLENPREGGGWWAAIYGVAQSRTRLKQLSSSNHKPKICNRYTHKKVKINPKHNIYRQSLNHEGRDKRRNKIVLQSNLKTMNKMAVIIYWPIITLKKLPNYDIY